MMRVEISAGIESGMCHRPCSWRPGGAGLLIPAFAGTGLSLRPYRRGRSAGQRFRLGCRLAAASPLAIEDSRRPALHRGISVHGPGFLRRGREFPHCVSQSRVQRAPRRAVLMPPDRGPVASRVSACEAKPRAPHHRRISPRRLGGAAARLSAPAPRRSRSRTPHEAPFDGPDDSAYSPIGIYCQVFVCHSRESGNPVTTGLSLNRSGTATGCPPSRA
jgi:hypothetical protein